jgi:hypothetical protein
MANLKLSVHDINADTEISMGNTYEEISSWVSSLPIDEEEKTASMLFSALSDLNRAEIDVGLRFRVVELLQPILDEVADSVTIKYIAANWPLSEKNKRRVILVQQLHMEMAYAWKRVLSEIFSIDEKDAEITSRIQEAIFYAIHNLSEHLVDHYLHYDPVPKRVWGELHGLYYFAESKGLHTRSVHARPEDAHTIEQAYMQILLLAVINPYRLMKGEAVKVYEVMRDKAYLCKFSNSGDNWQPHGEMTVNLVKDAPPSFAFEKSDIEQLSYIRILDVSDLRNQLKQHLSDIEDGLAGPTHTLTDRTQRDFYHRLIQGWGSWLDRSNSRKICSMAVDVTVGLSACFEVLDAGLEVYNLSEEDDMRVSGHALTSGEQDVWEGQPEDEGAAVGVAKFKLDDTSNELWYLDLADRKSIIKDNIIGHLNPGHVGKPIEFVTDTAEEDMDDKAENPLTLLNIDQSEGGMGLYFDRNMEGVLRVGEIICVRPAGNDDRALWRVGMIRWLQNDETRSGVLGVMDLANQVMPVLVKAVDGVGSGSVYNHALLVIRSIEERSGKIIVPSSVYDVGTVLSLRISKDTLRLTELLETGDSFAYYSYKFI